MAARWLDTKIDELIAEVASLGMVIDPASRAELGEAITDKVTTVAREMGTTAATTRRAFDHNVIVSLARSLVDQFAIEQPGLDIAAAAPNAALSPKLARLSLMALAEALRVHLANSTDPTVTVGTASQCADLVAIHAAALFAARDARAVPVTSAWLHRAARQIEDAAALLDAGGVIADDSGVAPARLADRFRRDAALMRDAAAPTTRRPLPFTVVE